MVAIGGLVACAAQSPIPPAVKPLATSAPATPVAAPPMFTKLPPALGEERVVFRLHKFLNEVGLESDSYLARADGSLEVKASFVYNDRTSLVPLAATVTFASDGTLRHYAAWGKTARWTQIDDRVDARPDGAYDVWRNDVATRVPVTGIAVVASGYAPMMLQDLVLRAWLQQGRPAHVSLLPEGELAIASRGMETYDQPSGKVTLEHVSISGLVWGVEDAWLDDKGHLAAVITRDAEFDHHEACLPELESLLPDLAKASAVDGVRRLAAGVQARSGVIALVGGTVIDGTGRPPLADAVVVIDGDRITAIGARGKVTIPADATTIDTNGMSIIAGLWDMHAHVEQVEQGAVYLAAGVTSVRDMGNVMPFITAMRDTIATGTGLGPRILVNGLVDGSGDGALGVIRIKKRADIAPVIDQLRKDGCIEVKIYSSIAPELVAPIIAYAHAHGMRTVGHVPEGMTTQQAIDAGYDSISHLDFLMDMFKTDPKMTTAEWLRAFAARDLANPALTKEIAALVAHHVVIDETLALSEEGLFTRAAFAQREPGVATLPHELLATLFDPPAKDADLRAAVFDKEVELVRLLHARGVILVAGTDIAVPGYSVLREVELYVLAGFTPLQAIQAATIVPARYMHLDRELGTVEVGKRADLVVVHGDPLAAISDLRKTAYVVARGKVYDSAALWKLAGFRFGAR
jgi:imidazolonepropionase-like amidohydrolase